MSTLPFNVETLLAVDVGEISTRAMLFDVVDGRYRFLATGSAPTTAGAPYFNISEGVRLAVDNLQEITGRTLVGGDERLLIPSLPNGSGADMFVATLSVGPPLKVVAVGLLDDVSLDSARHLAATTYAQVVTTFGLHDHLRLEDRIDTIIRLRPDVIAIAGGTDGGASQSVLKMVEAVGLACYLLPKGQRPEVIFAGNQSLSAEVEKSLGSVVKPRLAPNVRPALDVEQTSPAQVCMTEIFRSIRSAQIAGVHELDIQAGGRLFPSATAFGHVIRFLSQVYDPAKGVLGVEVGASATVVAATLTGEQILGVYPELGLGSGIAALLDHCPPLHIKRWIPFDIGDDRLGDYIQNKALYPASLPTTSEELAIEQAIIRQALRTAIGRASVSFPKNLKGARSDLLPWFEPIVAAGSVFTRAPSMAQTVLMLLDALQPTGISTLVLDQNDLTASLGAAAAINPLLVVQVLESSTFLNLGTVISPISDANAGAPILQIRAKFDSGQETSLEVKQGALDVLRLPMGQAAHLQLQPYHRADIGMGGPGRGGRLRVVGGALGVVIDARGRPLRLSRDAEQRKDLFTKWLWALGG